MTMAIISLFENTNISYVRESALFIQKGKILNYGTHLVKFRKTNTFGIIKGKP